MKNTFLVKALAVGAIALLLWLVLMRIGDLGLERQSRQREAQASVEASQAGRQTLMGPVLHSTCVEEWDTVSGEGKDRTTVTDRREFMLAATPARLDVQANVALEPRYRGIFKVNTYATKATLTGQWPSLAPLRAQRAHAGSRMTCSAPVVMVALSDARGIREAGLKVNGQAQAVVPGTLHGSHPRGFHVALPETLRMAEEPLSVEVTLEVVGTAELAMAPVANDTKVQLASNWPHPSFGGRFLPATRDVREDGFTATWQVSSLATTAPLAFSRSDSLCAAGSTEGGEQMVYVASEGKHEMKGCIETFSVEFIDPVNPYSLSDRAVKYGLLFIGLTFVAVGMMEALRGLRVHPIQYLFVGFALSIFFLLLLSLSEHLSFAVSYAIAGSACVVLLTAYARHLLAGWMPGLGFGAGVAALYGALYVLLQMEQTALVIGSLLLFGVLTAVMMVTRRIDWYSLLRSQRGNEAGPARPV
jgi:inner membrane protein